jgi:hypothetical protein
VSRHSELVKRMQREAEIRHVVFALYDVSEGSAMAGDVSEEAMEALNVELLAAGLDPVDWDED